MNKQLNKFFVCKCGHSWYRHIPGDEADECAVSDCKCEGFRE